MNSGLYAVLPFAVTMGAMVGSFLGVVAARVPALINATADGNPGFARTISAISWPGSHCASCKTPLSWRENVPVLAHLVLGGRCRHCREAFGLTSLMLEVGCATAAAACVLLYGWTLHAALAFALLATLLALVITDLTEMLLPDVLVWPLLPLGLFYHASVVGDLYEGLWGAATGFCVMWAIGTAYKMARKADGLGGGDVKLAAGMGAWVGLTQMPFFLIAAFACGTVVMAAVMAVRHARTDTPLPFGPFLAASGALCVLFPDISRVVYSALAV